MGFVMPVLLVLLAASTGPTRAQPSPPCVGKYPLEPGVIGEWTTQVMACSIGGQHSESKLHIHDWGLYFSPLSSYFSGCREEIVVTYTKVNRPAMLYHRPQAKPEYFAKSHPRLFKRFQDNAFVKFPCHMVPARSVHVWRNRMLFVSLVKKAVYGVRHIRSLDCSAPGYYGNPNEKYSWSDVRHRIAADRMATAALTFLHGVAYSNFFCVK